MKLIENEGFSGFTHLSTLAHALRASMIEPLISKLKQQRCKQALIDPLTWHTIDFRRMAVPSLQLKHLGSVDCYPGSCTQVEGAGIFCTQYSSTFQSGNHCEDLRESRSNYVYEYTSIMK